MRKPRSNDTSGEFKSSVNDSKGGGMSMEQADRAQLKVVTTDQAPGLTSNLEAHRTLGMSPVSLCLSKPSQPAGRLKDVRGMLLCSLVACRYTFLF